MLEAMGLRTGIDLPKLLDVRRILREVHALEALNHPNIVRCSPCCARPVLCHCTVPLPAQVQALVARMPRRLRILPSGADAVRSRPPHCAEPAPIAINAHEHCASSLANLRPPQRR